MLNDLLQAGDQRRVHVLVYGRHSCDDLPFQKASQLRLLGSVHVFHYVGGLFEWLLLQDMYGDDAFATTTKDWDLLKFAPHRQLGVARIAN